MVVIYSGDGDNGKYVVIIVMFVMMVINVMMMEAMVGVMIMHGDGCCDGNQISALC